MNARILISAAIFALAGIVGSASAQDYTDRRGPNVMPSPQRGINNHNYSNTYGGPATQDRRGPNVMAMPDTPTQRSPRSESAPAEHAAQARPEAGANRSGPNIEGEATSMPSESTRSDRRSDGRGEATPACNRCVAI